MAFGFLLWSIKIAVLLGIFALPLEFIVKPIKWGFFQIRK